MCRRMPAVFPRVLARPFFLPSPLGDIFFDLFRGVGLFLLPRGRGVLGMVREVEIGVAERIEGRDRMRLKGNGEHRRRRRRCRAN